MAHQKVFAKGCLQGQDESVPVLDAPSEKGLIEVSVFDVHTDIEVLLVPTQTHPHGEPLHSAPRLVSIVGLSLLIQRVKSRALPLAEVAI